MRVVKSIFLFTFVIVATSCTQTITRQASRVDPHQAFSNKYPITFNLKDESKVVLRDVRIESRTVKNVEEVTFVGTNEAGAEAKLPLTRVSTLTYKEFDQEKTATVLGVTGGTALVAGIAALIVYIVHCNCPEVALNRDGKCTPVANLFPGALHQTLERTDQVALGAVKAGTSVEIRNNLNERQFINSVSIVAAKRKAGLQVVQTRDGMLLYARNGGELVSIPPELLKKDGRYADGDFFNRLNTRTLDSETTIEFKLKGAETNGLVLSLRNSDLYDAAFHEYMSTHSKYYRSQFKKWDREPYTATEMQNKLRYHGVLLALEGFNGSEWQTLDEIQPVGERFFRDIYLKISEPSRYQNYRLRFFPGVWQIDHVAEMQFFKPAEKRTLQVKFDNADLPSKLETADTNRLVLNKGDSVRMVPSIPSGQWDLFLEATGYYQLLINDKPEFNSSSVATVTHHKFTEFAGEYFKNKVTALELGLVKTSKL